MTCAEFQRWLDEGRPEPERSRMTGHLAECTHCEQELAAAVEVERFLVVVVPVAVSPDFDDRVMRRIHAPRRSRWGWILGIGAQIVAEPLVPTSIALAVLIAWYRETLAIQLTAGADRAMRAIDRLPWLREMTIGRAMIVAALILCVSWRIFRAVQQAGEMQVRF